MHSLVFISDNVDKTICDILHILPDAQYRMNLCDITDKYKSVLTRDVFNGFNLRNDYHPEQLLISVTSDREVIKKGMREYYLNNESFLRNGDTFITLRSIAKMANDQYSLEDILDTGIKLNTLKENFKEKQLSLKPIQFYKENHV